MRKAFGLLIVAAALLCLPGCGREKKAESGAAEGGPRMATTVHLGDPKSAPQLVSGFHDIEGNSWRWTQRRFAVDLGTPPGAAQNGATLELDFTVPQPVLDQLKSVTLTASVDGNPLPPETYSQPGVYAYKRDVPGTQLGKDPVRVSFELDKAIPSSPADARELGVVASTIGLKAK